MPSIGMFEGLVIFAVAAVVVYAVVRVSIGKSRQLIANWAEDQG